MRKNKIFLVTVISTPLLIVYSYLLGYRLDPNGGQIFAYTQILITIVFAIFLVLLSGFVQKSNVAINNLVFKGKRMKDKEIEERVKKSNDIFNSKFLYGFNYCMIFLAIVPTVALWIQNKQEYYLLFLAGILISLFVFFVLQYYRYLYKETKVQID